MKGSLDYPRPLPSRKFKNELPTGCLYAIVIVVGLGCLFLMMLVRTASAPAGFE